MPLLFADVEEILRIIDRFPAAEIRFEHGDVKLYVRRAGAVGTPPAAVPAPPLIAAPASAVPAPGPAPAAPPPSPKRAAADVDRSGQVSIDAPLAGVFYAAPSPDAAPFVQAGQTVADGAPLCIIEVMKVMNTIKAPLAGTVVDVVAENGAAVERDEPLMWIRPAAAQP